MQSVYFSLIILPQHRVSVCLNSLEVEIKPVHCPIDQTQVVTRGICVSRLARHVCFQFFLASSNIYDDPIGEGFFALL